MEPPLDFEYIDFCLTVCCDLFCNFLKDQFLCEITYHQGPQFIFTRDKKFYNRLFLKLHKNKEIKV